MLFVRVGNLGMRMHAFLDFAEGGAFPKWWRQNELRYICIFMLMHAMHEGDAGSFFGFYRKGWFWPALSRIGTDV